MDVSYEDILICGICLESFAEDSKSPRVLPCGHSFCLACLDKLLTHQSPCCHTCKSAIQFNAANSIPVNYAIKGLLNISGFKGFAPTEVRDTGNSLVVYSGQPLNPNKYRSEGYCSEHDNLKEMRCMSCDVWICSMCAFLQHKQCRVRLVNEAYKELKKRVSKRVEKDLLDRKSISEGLYETLRILNEERDSLIDEIKSHKQGLIKKEKRIQEIESLISEEIAFCDKLQQLQKKAESSENGAEFSETTNELFKFLEEGKKHIMKHLRISSLPQTHSVGLFKLLEEGKKQIPKHLQNCLLPQTYSVPFLLPCSVNNKIANKIHKFLSTTPYFTVGIEGTKALETLCQNEPVYAVEARFDGIRYGKVTVKDGRIWVHHFSLEKPDAKLYTFKDILFLFNISIKLPRTVFLQLTPEGGQGDSCQVVIDIVGNSQRARNFIYLCSNLKGSSYMGFKMHCSTNGSFHEMNPGPIPVVGEIRNCDLKSPMKDGGVYGMAERSSWFRIQMKDRPSVAHPKFGVVTKGLQILKDRLEEFFVTDCGLVI